MLKSIPGRRCFLPKQMATSLASQLTIHFFRFFRSQLFFRETLPDMCYSIITRKGKHGRAPAERQTGKPERTAPQKRALHPGLVSQWQTSGLSIWEYGSDSHSGRFPALSSDDRTRDPRSRSVCQPTHPADSRSAGRTLKGTYSNHHA